MSKPILDAPDSELRSILLKPPGSWDRAERKHMAERMQVEDQLGLGPNDPNSVRYGLAGQTPAAPVAPTENATPAAPAPRGGSQAFEDQMQQHGDYMGAINDGSHTLPGGITTPARPLNVQTPGTAYRPNNPAIGVMSPLEKAAGAYAGTPILGTPGAYGVDRLPSGFSSYQNRDGGWTVMGPDGKPQKFANEQDASTWLNGGGGTANATGAGGGAAPTPPFAPPPGYDAASPAAQARMRDESTNANDLAKYGAPSGAPAKATHTRQVGGPERVPSTLENVFAAFGRPETNIYGQMIPSAPPGAPTMVAAFNGDRGSPAPAAPVPPVETAAGSLNPFRNAGIDAGVAAPPLNPMQRYITDMFEGRRKPPGGSVNDQTPAAPAQAATPPAAPVAPAPVALRSPGRSNPAFGVFDSLLRPPGGPTAAPPQAAPPPRPWTGAPMLRPAPRAMEAQAANVAQRFNPFAGSAFTY